jgi:hypothetical protein
MELVFEGLRMREIPDYPGYWASEDGHIYSTKRETPHRLKGHIHKDHRYLMVSLYDPSKRYYCKGKDLWTIIATPRYVHRLVASVWLPPQPTPAHEIDHKDGNRHNNHPDNLQWVTRTQNNQLLRLRHPNLFRGEQNSQSKLTTKQVKEIRSKKGAILARQLAPMYGVHSETISKIWRRVLWTHI